MVSMNKDAINTQLYKLVKFFVPILFLLTFDRFRIKNLLKFAKVTIEINNDYFKGSISFALLYTSAWLGY